MASRVMRNSAVSQDVRDALSRLMASDGSLTMAGRNVTFEALKQKLVAAVSRNKDQAVLVRGDKAAQFGIGLQVLDTCRMAKVKKVDFAALPSKKG